MSGLPDQISDPDAKYSEADVQHIVSREVMKQRLSDLEARIREGERKVSDMFSRIEAGQKEMFGRIEAGQEMIRSIVSRGTDQIRECRKEIEDDMREKYATKVSLERLEGKLNTFATKIITGVAVLMIVVQFVAPFFLKAMFV